MVGAAEAAILDSAVAEAAVRRRFWGVAFLFPSLPVRWRRLLPLGGGGAAAVASTAMAATTANPGEETEDWGASKGEGLKGLTTKETQG